MVSLSEPSKKVYWLGRDRSAGLGNPVQTGFVSQTIREPGKHSANGGHWKSTTLQTEIKIRTGPAATGPEAIARAMIASAA